MAAAPSRRTPIGRTRCPRRTRLPPPGEAALLDAWEAGTPPPPPADARVAALDDECRLAAFDPLVSPASLLMLQAALEGPPASWKKHSLPSLVRAAGRRGGHAASGACGAAALLGACRPRAKARLASTEIRARTDPDARLAT